MRLDGEIPTQYLEKHGWIKVYISEEVFYYSGYREELKYVVTLADGSPLPSWLSYDKEQNTLSGKPPKNAPESLYIKVEAKDDKGNKATAEFQIILQKHSVQSSSLTPDLYLRAEAQHVKAGKPALAEQFKQMGNSGAIEQISQLAEVLWKKVI